MRCIASAAHTDAYAFQLNATLTHAVRCIRGCCYGSAKLKTTRHGSLCVCAIQSARCDAVSAVQDKVHMRARSDIREESGFEFAHRKKAAAAALLKVCASVCVALSLCASAPHCRRHTLPSVYRERLCRAAGGGGPAAGVQHHASREV
jgi:hypothetical protein